MVKPGQTRSHQWNKFDEPLDADLALRKAEKVLDGDEVDEGIAHVAPYAAKANIVESKDTAADLTTRGN